MSFALVPDRSFNSATSMPASSASVNNYSANQASSGYTMIPSALPSLSSASAFGPSFTPGAVNAPFASPYVIPFSSPELQRQFNVAGLQSAPQKAMALSATDNFSCSIVTVDGLERGQGCTVKKGSDAAVTVDLSGTNPYNYAAGGNSISVVGDPNSQMCVVSYTDAFDTASFQLRPNGRFENCI